MAKWIIFGTILNLALTLSPRSVQSASSVSRPSPAPSVWEKTNPRPLLAPRYNRFDPGNLRDRLMAKAQQYLKTPYRRGGSLQTGKATDCSGFVQYLYGKANIHLPRASVAQARVGRVAARSMNFSRLQAGDLLFFRSDGRHIGHVGIYLGDGKMIHAACHKLGVTVSDLHRPFYRNRFVVAKRVFKAPDSYQHASLSDVDRAAIN
jgi:cell wall-associated NlpC family hydrolase